ncbi:hypothetical protein HFV02_10770 [Acidithiobacillus caldus]|jgi:hypothetical protein|uniref:Uncharacterized protein n=2 Tax=Acidithiobacillus caldus TaxID=33059 RepID=F9ZS79_ACICS|nr:conserved hypothetical protein [Acidithiobacillus caldus SM-1]MBU2802714.1 hypothetical protein [Acidithiobacillus caldus]QER45997.1 hypothetical protein F0726_02951 [Acidithiobacillus caldus]
MILREILDAWAIHSSLQRPSHTQILEMVDIAKLTEPLILLLALVK